jgi:hypothetical protein
LISDGCWTFVREKHLTLVTKKQGKDEHQVVVETSSSGNHNLRGLAFLFITWLVVILEGGPRDLVGFGLRSLAVVGLIGAALSALFAVIQKSDREKAEKASQSE